MNNLYVIIHGTGIGLLVEMSLRLRFKVKAKLFDMQLNTCI